MSDPPAEEPGCPVQSQEAVVQEAPWAPVPESEAVEDTYFQDVIFLGDSRTEGFSLYSGLKEGTYFYSVGATVESVFSQNAWTMEDGSKVPLLDAMAEEPCGKIYVMLGVNELGLGSKSRRSRINMPRSLTVSGRITPTHRLYFSPSCRSVPSRTRKRPM